MRKSKTEVCILISTSKEVEFVNGVGVEKQTHSQVGRFASFFCMSTEPGKMKVHKPIMHTALEKRSVISRGTDLAHINTSHR